MSRFDALLLDYANTVVRFDRPQIEAIHARLAELLSDAVAPIEASALGRVMDHVCVQAPLTPEKLELTALEQMRRVLQSAYERPFLGTDKAVVAANSAYQELFVSSLAIEDEALAALRRLGRRAHLGLVSNYPCGASMRRSLSTLGIADLFRVVVISGDVGYVKPHPRIFEIALERIGVAPERVLFVGDSWSCDMLGGHAAGMVTCHHVGLTSERDHERRYASYRPDFSVRHLEELDAILAPA